MDWIKLWTTVHDDPGMLRLSDRAFRVCINAWSWAGHHETDGVFELVGKRTREIDELVEAGKLEVTDDPTQFLIHGWPWRQQAQADVEAKRASASAAAHARWSAPSNASRIAPSNARTNAEKSREEKSRSTPPPSPPFFDEFWSTYPRREGKGAARTAFAKAVAKVETPSVILLGAERFAADPNREDGYTPHPATWLNQERWNDDPLPNRNGSSRKFDNASHLAEQALAERRRYDDAATRSDGLRGLPPGQLSDA
jgi:hypothetical protein